MHWNVYADLAASLTADERRTVFTALDAIVPDSGCVGPSRNDETEVFFRVEASSREDAELEAGRYVDAVLERAEMSIGYQLTVTRSP